MRRWARENYLITPSKLLVTMLRSAHDQDSGPWLDLSPYHFCALWGQNNICQELYVQVLCMALGLDPGVTLW